MQEAIYDTEAAAEEDSDRALAALGVTREQVLAELQYRQAKKYQQVITRMAAAQRAGGERRRITGADGDTGAVEMMIDPISYHYWGQRLGYECWEDDAFRREYRRDNPSSRIKTLSRIMFTPSLAVQARLGREKSERGMVKSNAAMNTGLVTA